MLKYHVKLQTFGNIRFHAVPTLEIKFLSARNKLTHAKNVLNGNPDLLAPGDTEPAVCYFTQTFPKSYSELFLREKKEEGITGEYGRRQSIARVCETTEVKIQNFL